MKYECELRQPFFGQIVRGEKTVEGRLNKDKWSKMRAGDMLHIKDIENPYVSIPCLIVKVTHAATFQELHSIYGTKLLPDIAPEDHEAAANVYRNFFTDDLVKHYEVVGIEVQVLY